MPRATVVKIAESYRELMALKDKQAGTQAQMIRACIAKIRQDYKDAPAYRRAEGLTKGNAAMREHHEEQRKAFLYLEALATMLENQSRQVT